MTRGPGVPFVLLIGRGQDGGEGAVLARDAESHFEFAVEAAARSSWAVAALE